MYLSVNYICCTVDTDGKQCNLSPVFFNGLAHKNRSVVKRPSQNDNLEIKLPHRHSNVIQHPKGKTNSLTLISPEVTTDTYMVLGGPLYIFHMHRSSVIMRTAHKKGPLTCWSLNTWASGIGLPRIDAIMDGHPGEQTLEGGKINGSHPLSSMLHIGKMPAFSTTWKRCQL